MIVYLAHPVGDDPVQRKRNLESVSRWFRFLVTTTDWTICVPWFIYVTNLDESYRDRAIRDDLYILGRCDAICLVGGKTSPGMALELEHAVDRKLRVFDLTAAGSSPGPEARRLLPLCEAH